MNIKFWSNKNHVEYWLETTVSERCSVHTIGSGNRGILLYILDSSITPAEFIEKYKQIITKYTYGYFSLGNYGDGNPIYISLRKKGYTYGGKHIIK